MQTTRIIAAYLICLTSSLIAAAEEQPKLTIQSQKEGHRSMVMIGDDPFVGFNFVNTPKPYLYPIVGPTGSSMTRHFPMNEDVEGEAKDHPHHRSLWFAHGKVNGVDFWHEKSNAGLVKPERSTHIASPSQRPTIKTHNSWINSDELRMADVVTEYAFEVLTDESRIIDFHKAIQPAKGMNSLVFGDTKEGTMAIRLAPQLRLKGEVATGKAINSNGDKDGNVWGKRAKWVAYWGVIDGKTCGVAIFDHPTNLRHPTWWHARDYGLVAANPFGISDFEKGKHKRGAGNYTLKQGETLNLRYRFVFFAGTSEEVDIAGKYEQWVKETMPVEAEKK